jgi:hypothetical protein
MNLSLLKIRLIKSLKKGIWSLSSSLLKIN